MGRSYGSGSYDYNRKFSSFSPLKEVITMLEELDEKSQIVDRKQEELNEAKARRDEVVRRIKQKIGSLDNNASAIIKGALASFPEYSEFEDRGRSR